jgi:hypothetical protein
MVSERNSNDKPFRDHSSALDKALDRYRKGLICLEFSEFNQPINMWEWEVSKGKSFNGMFWSTQFIQPIASWDVASCVDFSWMFVHSKFKQPIATWNVYKGERFSYMFSDFKFNHPLDTWNVSKGERFLACFIDPSSTNLYWHLGYAQRKVVAVESCDHGCFHSIPPALSTNRNQSFRHGH